MKSILELASVGKVQSLLNLDYQDSVDMLSNAWVILDGADYKNIKTKIDSVSL